MVTRRTRNFKEKSTASNILGRLIMPVAVIMALALFYFSIKLFFFSPPRGERPLPSTVNPPAVTETYENGDDYGDNLPPLVDMDDTSTITPETPPAEQKPEPASVENPKPAETKTVQKPAEKPKPSATRQPTPAQSSGPRWDVQIGGFRARSGAELTVKQAREKGYSAYVVDEKLDGKPFYKVRVRGHSDKNETRALSRKLAAMGFPVYVVSVK